MMFLKEDNRRFASLDPRDGILTEPIWTQSQLVVHDPEAGEDPEFGNGEYQSSRHYGLAGQRKCATQGTGTSRVTGQRT